MTSCRWCMDDPDAATFAAWKGRLPVSLSGNEAPPARGGVAARKVYAKARDAWRFHLLNSLRGNAVPYANGLRRLTFVRWAAERIDDDNLATGCKPIRDCFTLERLIRDDDHRWVRVHYVQELAVPGGERLEWHLEALTREKPLEVSTRCQVCKRDTSPDDRVPFKHPALKVGLVAHSGCTYLAQRGEGLKARRG